MYYCRFQDFKAFTSNGLSFTTILHVIHFHSERQWLKGWPQNHTGSDRQSFGEPPDTLTPCPEVSRATSPLQRETVFHYCPCAQKPIAPVLVSNRKQNVTALCLRTVMFQHLYKSSSCYVPWTVPTEELLITSSDSYWLSYSNTSNMQYLCQIKFLKFTCNLPWSFWVISTSIPKYKLKATFTGNILSEVKWHMPDPWPIGTW